MKRDGEEVPVEMAQEVDEQFIFLEQFPTDKKVENPVSSAHPAKLQFAFEKKSSMLVNRKKECVSASIFVAVLLNEKSTKMAYVSLHFISDE
jgi:hypothetical protein